MSAAANGQTALRITDTTFRDAHQSVAATRLRTRDMEPIAEEMGQVGFHSMEVWGGATFDVATRFLFEDPWERARVFKRLMPDTPLQMLLRGQNLVGYRHYADDVVEAFVQHAADSGIDIFRVFDALNDVRNLETAARAVKATGKHLQLCVCYSVTEGRMGGAVYNLDYYLEKAKTLEAMGADSICIKDMAGILAPYDAYTLGTTFKKELRVPVQLHTHYTTGMASMAALKAAEAGIDVIDACLSPLALRTSQPAVESLIIALQGTPRETGLDLERLLKLGGYLETLSGYLQPHLVNGRLAVVDPGALVHQVPGGMISNLMSQLREAEALDRLPEVLEELPRARKELGSPPLVTPTSQILGAQAVNNVIFGRWKVITGQVKDYVYGLYGRPPLPVDPSVVEVALDGYSRGKEPLTGRPADILEPELEKARKETEGLAKDMGDVLIYALYQVTGQRFLRVKYGLEEAPSEEPPPAAAKPTAPAPAPARPRFAKGAHIQHLPWGAFLPGHGRPGGRRGSGQRGPGAAAGRKRAGRRCDAAVAATGGAQPGCSASATAGRTGPERERRGGHRPHAGRRASLFRRRRPTSESRRTRRGAGGHEDGERSPISDRWRGAEAVLRIGGQGKPGRRPALHHTRLVRRTVPELFQERRRNGR